MKKTEILTMDFETTTVVNNESDYREKVKGFTPEVYSWAICKRNDRKDYKIVDGINIESFLDTILEFNKDYVAYFHNGSKFDLHFLLPELLRQGFKQVVNKNYDSDYSDIDLSKEYETVTFIDKPRRLKYGEFSMVVDSSHKIMEMKIGLKDTKKGTDKNRALIIRDSNLMFPSTLAGYGNSLNSFYNTDEYSKKELDNGYTKSEMYKDYDEFLNDGNEREYLHQDVIILSEFLHMMTEVIPFNKWKMTAAGTAYNIWKYDYFGKMLLDKNIKNGNVERHLTSKSSETNKFYKYRFKGNFKWISSKLIINNLFDKVLPCKWLEDVNIDGIESNYRVLQESYQGGLTMANPDHAGKLQKNLAYIDINSSYPTQMMNGEFPIGPPIFGEITDIGKNTTTLYELDIEYAHNSHGIPFLYDFLDNDEGKHYPKTLEDKQYTLTDIEIERFEKYYDGDYTIRKVATFDTIKGETLFGSYINYWYEIKSTTKSIAWKIAAKLFLNALYGKFGQDIARDSKIFLDNKWVNISSVTKPRFFLPIAIWITAYARMYMVDAIDYNFKDCNYMDTDSLSIIIPENIDLNNDKELTQYLESNYNVKIDNNILGGWDIEEKLNWQITRRAKQYYMETIDGKRKLKFAGLNLDKEQLNDLSIKEFVLGKKGFKQKRPYRSLNGIVIEQYDKEIKPIWEYKLNPSYWFNDENEYKN